ncbi:MAG: PSD1 and planctomycete cytochrome C domain-containing protein [Terriglobia bacterium]
MAVQKQKKRAPLDWEKTNNEMDGFRSALSIRGLRCNLTVLPLLLLCVGGYKAQTQLAAKPDLPPAATQKIDFKRDVQPILSSRCLSCHGPQMQMSGLRLDSRQHALDGGNSGAVIKPADSAGSKLIRLVAGADEGKVMPPAGDRLTAEQVGLLRAWIDQGVDWSEDGAKPIARASEDPRRSHWAFQPLKQPPLPRVGNSAWIRNPIDAFILSKLESEQVQPSPEADRITLIRRLSFDLTGLPPTPEEVSNFVADDSPDAYERLVNRLLDSPHYGEKWARHWLDLARYADSDGYEKDNVRPYAWRYRQWVIEALNRNLPFDEFTIEQIAGDQLPRATLNQKIATGFNRNTLTNREGGVDNEEFRVEQVLDRTITTGTTWMGLTIGCARCHDHKYDPISQREFYQLLAFFNTAREVNVEAPSPGEIGGYLQGKPEYDKKRKALLEEYKVAEIQGDWEKKTLEASTHPGINVPYDVSWDTVGKMLDHGQEILLKNPTERTQKEQDRLTDHIVRYYSIAEGKDRYDELKFKELGEKLDQLSEQYPSLTEAPTITENPNPPKTHVLIRGDYLQPGIEVSPGTPAVLPPFPVTNEPARLRFARWLVSSENPLTPRVTMNRMWQEFFGHGIVETSEDFGIKGERPTHPELLDWLAAEFVRENWNVKRMHKLIVMSATYRQSSKTRKELEARDPYNKWIARQSRLRLPAELIRDNALATSGLLDPTIGGKSVRPVIPKGVTDLGYAMSVKWKESEGTARYRRGLYVFFQRTTPYPELMNFDAPNSLLVCSRRERSTTPLQALNLLNDPVFFEAAQGLATRVLREKPGSLNERIDYAFRLCLARPPKPAERERLVRYYDDQKAFLKENPDVAESLYAAHGVEGVDATEAAIWVSISRALLNLDEFITRG